MIEHARSRIALPMSDSDRKRAYLIRLVCSPHYDEHEHARRVADGLAALRRLQAKWRRREIEKRLAKLPQRPLLTLTKRTA